MNPFESFLLNFTKAAIVTAPAALPIFVHSSNAIAIANVSEDFLAAFLSMVQTTQTPAPAAAPAPVVNPLAGTQPAAVPVATAKAANPLNPQAHALA
jgi:hypothetical protein